MSTLHITNGDSAAGTLREFLRDPVVITADPLYEGPAPEVDGDAWLDARCGAVARNGSQAADVRHALAQWDAAIAGAARFDEVVLWFEHDLFDQLNLIQLLSWLRERLPAGKPVGLVCIGSFPGRPSFKGLGELSPDELASLLDTREPVGAAQYDLAERAWRAFREPNPEALEALRRTDTSALPYLAAAIGRFLQEYPWTRDGLSRSERRLLHLAEGGPIGIAAAFPRMQDGESAYYITDLSLAALVDTLSRTSPPLLAIADGAGRDRWSLQGTVVLTDAGREVLTGRRDRVACGTDRWLGGVHVQTGAADDWRWDDDRRRMVRR